MNLRKLKEQLFCPIHIYSLVFIRIAFGLIMFVDIIKYFHFDLITYLYTEPQFHFKYYGFEWIKILPPTYLKFLFLYLAILAIFIAIGFFYRISSILFLLGFTYIFLLEKALYLNHYYMIILFNFLLCLMPANRYFSIDATYIFPKIKSRFIAAWSVILLRIQMEIILIYAGLVKINSDWLQSYPLKFWFGHYGSFFSNDLIIAIASYGSILLHVIGAPLLLFKATRIWIFLIYTIFHSINCYVFKFDIGIFPWITLALTTIFFTPDWPIMIFSRKKTKERIVTAEKFSQKKENLIILFIIIWTVFHILFPLRKLFYQGNSAWHQQGYYFSWQMKLHNFEGIMFFQVKDNKNNIYLQDYYPNWQFDSVAKNTKYLTLTQAKAMGCKPYMILQYAHLLKEKWSQEIGHGDISVYATIICSLNGRKPQLLVDPNIDLGKEREDWSYPKWLLPLDESLKPGQGGFRKWNIEESKL